MINKDVFYFVSEYTGFNKDAADRMYKLAMKKGQKIKPESLKGGKSKPSSKAKAGSGGRFKALTKKLGKKKGIKDPKALAASLGRAKFGKKKFQSMAKAGSDDIRNTAFIVGYLSRLHE